MSSPVADFELTVAGFARLFGGQLDDEVRSVLRDGVGDAADGDWAAVFAYAHYPDGTVEKVTIFTSEAGYAQRLAGPAGGRIPLPLATVQQRFPRVHPGWVIDNGDLPPAGTARVDRVARGAGEGGDGSDGSKGTVARAATHLSPGAPAQAEAQAPPEHAGSSRPAPGRPRRRAAARHRLGRQ